MAHNIWCCGPENLTSSHFVDLHVDVQRVSAQECKWLFVRKLCKLTSIAHKIYFRLCLIIIVLHKSMPFNWRVAGQGRVCRSPWPCMFMCMAMSSEKVVKIGNELYIIFNLHNTKYWPLHTLDFVHCIQLNIIILYQEISEFHGRVAGQEKGSGIAYYASILLPEVWSVHSEITWYAWFGYCYRLLSKFFLLGKISYSVSISQYNIAYRIVSQYCPALVKDTD